MTELIVSRINSVYQHFYALLWCQGSATHSVRKSILPASLLKRKSQYLLLLIPKNLVRYKSFGDWKAQYITCKRKILYMWMMPEEISHVLDHVGSVKTDWIDWIDNMNIIISRAKAVPGKGSAEGCNFKLGYWPSLDPLLTMPSAVQGSSQW